MESSKATAKHIQQVAGEIPAGQVHLMHHQCTQLPPGKEIELDIWPETAKPQDAGCSHDTEDTQHAETRSLF